jgi:hypothetical protein
MSAREKKTIQADEDDFAAEESEERLPAQAESEESRQYEVASAKSIPRPGTAMASPPKGLIGKASVTLLGDMELAPTLEEVQKINKETPGDARTPLMTVIHALLAKHGGTMAVEELAGQVLKYWNRPLPSSPYNTEEFIYIMVRNSESVRVSE